MEYLLKLIFTLVFAIAIYVKKIKCIVNFVYLLIKTNYYYQIFSQSNIIFAVNCQSENISNAVKVSS